MKTSSNGRAAPRYPIESVDNALRLLAMFTSEERIRVKEAAERLDVAMGTAHRLLAMLLYHGFVVQEPATKAYVPGPLLLKVGVVASQRADLRSRARPMLERLHTVVPETVHIAVLHDAEVFFLDGIESPKALRVVSRAGSSYPAHCTSVGKALLAGLDDSRVRELFPTEQLVQVTENSIQSRQQLLHELALVRARGYATNVGELEDDIASVAVPVRAPAGHVVAAIGIGAPVSRFRDVPPYGLVSHVSEAASELEADLAVFGEALSAVPSTAASVRTTT